jgi:thioredoxin-related protein
MFKYILYIFAFLVTSICIASQPSILVSSIDEAVNLAKEIDSVALVIFTSDSCRYCVNLKKDFEHYPSMIDNKIICYIEYDKNRALAKKYNVKSLPHSVIISDNNIVKEYIGYEKVKYSEWLKQ